MTARAVRVENLSKLYAIGGRMDPHATLGDPLATDHGSYDWGLIRRQGQVIVDTRHALRKYEEKEAAEQIPDEFRAIGRRQRMVQRING